MIDLRSSKDGGLAVGDTTTVLAPEPVEVTVVGTARFDQRDSQAGVTAALFSAEGARAHLADGEATVDRILVDAEPGADQGALVRAITEVTADGTETISGAAFAEENRSAVDDVMGFLRPTLLSFALIALLVASFSIYNTFTIIVAQRTREAAMLRAIGAGRGQTLRAVLAEALLVGIVASLAGVGLGIGLASVLGAVLGSGGLAPGGSLVVEVATLALCATIGTAITVLCAVGPAIRASRVAPIEALRATAIDRSGATRGRLVAGGLLVALGAFFVVRGTAGPGGMAAAALGVGALLVALAVLGPALAGPVGRILGVPLRLRGVTGDLARQNAIRNPRRTASSSMALMIGVAVVALFTVLGASLRSSLDQIVEDGFGGDLVASSGFGDAGFDPEVGRRIATLPEVEAAAGFGNAPMRIDGRDEVVGVSDPAQVGRVMDLGVAEGSLADLTGPSIAVSRDEAEARDWRLGTEVPYEFLDGTTGTVTVRTIFTNTDFAPELLAETAFAEGHGAPVNDVLVAIELRSGVSIDEGRRAVRAATADVPTVDVQDKDEFAETVGAQVNQILFLVYGMLGLSILIALIGIANTLSLSTFERTRELGLLRAVGQSRRQMRAMVRWESVVIAVFGTTSGLVMGIGGAWALVASANDEELSTFAVPGGQMVVVLALGALAGVLAALRPAARAAKLDPLQAISAV